jgi:phosphoribosyl 1,2-cyclic phosphate phosphodiesterase
MKITILGCGASGGVPLITGEWGSCNPDNPKNRRRRASVLVQTKGKNILIDTTPDLRMQLLDAGIGNIDVVLYTHDHADHVGGIDDLRKIYDKYRQQIPVYADHGTLGRLRKAYRYALVTLDPLYPAFLDGREFDELIDFEGIQIIPYLQYHGHRSSFGFRIGDFAYSTDLIALPEESYEVLKGVKIWVVNCLQDKPHISHVNVEQSLQMIAQVKPERAILTHMTHHLDYDDIASRIPSNVTPAYDGMVLELLGD